MRIAGELGPERSRKRRGLPGCSSASRCFAPVSPSRLQLRPNRSSRELVARQPTSIAAPAQSTLFPSRLRCSWNHRTQESGMTDDVSQVGDSRHQRIHIA
eukprot:2023065-Rhodomonas_salina.6